MTETPHKNPHFFISMTTIPSRFPSIHHTIDSILQQTVLPAKIIINIPKQYNFRFSETITDQQIEDFQAKYAKLCKNGSIIVHRPNYDFGPATKFLGFLLWKQQQQEQQENSFVVAIDDDCVYKSDMLQGFVKTSKTNDAASYCINEIGYANLRLYAGEAVNGFMIKIDKLDNFMSFYNIIKTSKTIKHHDDVFISFYLHLTGTKITSVPYIGSIYVNHTYVDALYHMTGSYGREVLDRKVIALLYAVFIARTMLPQDLQNEDPEE